METERQKCASSKFKVPKTLVNRTDNDQPKPSGYRTEFMRDRDRLMYAMAFRRLAGKTQIYTVGAVDDHRKNRLTHTLEVAEIARTIAHALGLDENLAEAIALGHDLGHTPFGHAGEEMLHMIMSPQSKKIKDSPFRNGIQISGDDLKYAPIIEKQLNKAYGFKHNIQSVRVATTLEDTYQDKNFNNIGLNLTNYTLYGMMTHSKMSYSQPALQPEPNFQSDFSDKLNLKGSTTEAWSFEAFIVEWADDIAQWHHDLEDALLDGVMPLNEICDTVSDTLAPLITEQNKSYKIADLKATAERSGMSRLTLAKLSNIVVDTLVSNLVTTSKDNFEELKAYLYKEHNLNICNENDKEKLFLDYQKYANDSFASDDYLDKKKEQNDAIVSTPKDAFGGVIALSCRDIKGKFKSTIGEWIHHSRNVQRMNAKGQFIIRKLFAAYLANPQQLPNGPILHLLIDSNSDFYKKYPCSPEEKAKEKDQTYTQIDKAKEAGIGAARVELDKRLKKNDLLFRIMLMRRICDHIASMTDHYAIEEYDHLYG